MIRRATASAARRPSAIDLGSRRRFEGAMEPVVRLVASSEAGARPELRDAR